MDCKHSIVVDEGEQVCELCGVIMSKIIDESAEWRNYETKEMISAERVYNF